MSRDPELDVLIARYASNGTGGVSLADVHEGFARWLALPDHAPRSPYETVDIALATIIANRMDGDPLWLFLVAPPSGGKTEIIRALDDVRDVFPLSALTPNTFASGFERRGVETSLLPKLDGKTLLMKDFGTVLTMYREARGEILAQLREIYDGSFSKEWGNGKSLKWTGKVGLLAGVTGIIDREYSLNAILGERFLLYRVPRAEGRALARAALGQRQQEAEHRRTLRRLVAAFVDSLTLSVPAFDPVIAEGLAALAEFTALARSPVFFDARGEHISLIPEPEAPGRLVKQLAALGQALAVVRGEGAYMSVGTYLTIGQVAQDTIPAPRRLMLEAILAAPDDPPPTTSALGELTRYPTPSARRYLEELAAVRLVDRRPEGPGRPDRWAASAHLRELLGAMATPSTEGGSVREGVVSE